ncbi:hypothetical protein [Lentzea sp. NEAU-D7]|uniref:hypothetical protein n=1 Tax=Lentzea sp. NEAU-D7 TaxID=2994667 RepID=UPI00224A94D0|nr:hypothetical protein [Lentzea sp. NEAU-D7]MCX2946761.1 hypothetical protein [Lentzea sp. NEAU-D7]
MLFKRIGTVAAGVAAATMLVTAAAAATPAADTPGEGVLTTTSAVSAAALPSGCIGMSDVYKTSTDGGRANGQGIIDCEYVYARLHAETNLYRDRWNGPDFLDSDSSTGNNTDWVASISVWRCAGVGTYTYRSSAYHEARTVGGDVYTATTSDSARFSC